MPSSEKPYPSRREAINILEEGRARIEELLDQLPRSAMTEPGVGGGTWSPKDLLGHLAFWEENALDALAAWERDERAPIDELLSPTARGLTLTTSQINDQAVARKVSRSLARVRRDADRTHSELLVAIRQMSDARWAGPVTSRGRKPLGARLGAILVGSSGSLFAHDAAHVKSLRSFAQRHGRP